MADSGTLIVWFALRSPDKAPAFEQLMASDRDTDLKSLSTVSSWYLTRPMDVPGTTPEPADYVLIAQIDNVELWEQEASDHLVAISSELTDLVSADKLLVVRQVL